MPQVLDIAIQTAIPRAGVEVVAILRDTCLREAVTEGPRLHFPPPNPTLCLCEGASVTLSWLQMYRRMQQL